MDGFLDAAGLVFDGLFGNLAICIVSVTYMVARLSDSHRRAVQPKRTKVGLPSICGLPGGIVVILKQPPVRTNRIGAARDQRGDATAYFSWRSTHSLLFKQWFLRPFTSPRTDTFAPCYRKTISTILLLFTAISYSPGSTCNTPTLLLRVRPSEFPY